MSNDEITTLTDALERGDPPPFTSLANLADPETVVNHVIESEAGRRWLRALDDLTLELAVRLLAHEQDFLSRRRDSSLARVVGISPQESLEAHATAIASGSAASALWRRLSSDPARLLEIASHIVTSGIPAAAENTLYLLILDPLDPYELGSERRASIARTALQSDAASIRTLAAEYLFDNDPAELAADFTHLVQDDDQRVRGLAWSAAIRSEPQRAFDLAVDLASQETGPIDIRRSALAAIGTHYPTSEVIELLVYFVAHPNLELALDAGNLLYRLHRHPTIATAAASSPHREVREIGQFLLDPYRGSPAAGGSRPGDPTSSDIFAELIRQTEERAFLDDDNDDPHRG